MNISSDVTEDFVTKELQYTDPQYYWMNKDNSSYRGPGQQQGSRVPYMINILKSSHFPRANS
jgi:hypothetical protein